MPTLRSPHTWLPAPDGSGNRETRYVTPRSDTFRVRAYGAAHDSSGRIVAESWCEAVVQRKVDYLDPADAPDARQGGNSDNGLSAINERFGRRFDCVSFRWMHPSEVNL